MERNKARSYIEAMIQQTTREGADQAAETLAYYTERSHAELARRAARDGLVYLIASHLRQATTLPTRQMGYLLAEAHRQYAGRREFDAKRNSDSPSIQERGQQEAQQSRRIAQNVTRAVKRA